MKNILLIEDNESILKGLVYSLEQERFKVTTAMTIKDSKNLLESNNIYNLIILDISLPDGSGFDLCKYIKSNYNIPIIFLTALEYKILALLFTNINQTVSREKILDKIWDIAGNYVNDNTLTVYIKRIRAKLSPNDIIKTIKGIGYRIEN